MAQIASACSPEEIGASGRVPGNQIDTGSRFGGQRGSEGLAFAGGGAHHG